MALPTNFAKDGLGTNIYFPGGTGGNAAVPSIYFVEVKVKLSGWDKRGGIDITNLRNSRVTTKLNKTLAQSNDMSLVVQVNQASGYAVVASDATAIINKIGTNQLFYFTSPPTIDNGLRYLYEAWGWCDKLEPQENSEGEQPLFDMTVIVSNTTNAGVEYPIRLLGTV